jgi:hypothetical protein
MFHACLFPGVQSSLGIEFDATKVEKAQALFIHLGQNVPAFAAAMKTKTPPVFTRASIVEV